MKITEISKPILDTLRNKEFKGNFEVAIYHPDMKAIKIDGDFNYDSNFRSELEYQIKNICFNRSEETSCNIIILRRKNLHR